MSYKYSFFDNQQVGAEDLNKLTNLFVTGGVADTFENGMPYSVSVLNNVVYANAGSGIVPETVDTLKVTLDGNCATIAPGTAFFDDGTVMVIETAENVYITLGKVQYIALKSSVSENRAYIICTENEPSENVVLLAKISEDGTVTDLRKYAKGKVPSFYCSDAGCAVKVNTSFKYGDTYLPLITGNRSCNYLLLEFKKVEKDVPQWRSFAFINLADGLAQSAYGVCRIDGDYDAVFFQKTDNSIVIASDNYGGAYVTICGTLNVTDGEIGLNLSFNSNALEDEHFYNSYLFPVIVTAYAF